MPDSPFLPATPATPSVAVRVQCIMQSDLWKEPGRSPSHICVVLAYGAITPRRGSGGCILNLVYNHTRVFPLTSSTSNQVETFPQITLTPSFVTLPFLGASSNKWPATAERNWGK